jgi:hypothetical protein
MATDDGLDRAKSIRVSSMDMDVGGVEVMSCEVMEIRKTRSEDDWKD